MSSLKILIDSIVGTGTTSPSSLITLTATTFPLILKPSNNCNIANIIHTPRILGGGMRGYI